MENWQAWLAAITFISIIGLVMTEWVQMTIAAMLGALLLIVCNVITLSEATNYIGQSQGTLLLFFGVMVMVRSFQPTGVFEYLGTQMVIWAQGRGDRLLLAIVGITTPICAVLPNATTVMLIAPLIPPIAQEVGVDFVPLLILLVFVANSSGLLTIVGDPATFIVGDAINLSFADYLWRLSLGGAIAVLTVVAVLPILFRRIWQTKLATLVDLPRPQISHPKSLALGGLILAAVLVLFVVGELLPVPLNPGAVALLGATLALLVAHHCRVDTLQNILRDVDWSTLIFFMSIFVLIGALGKTGVISAMSNILAIVLGKNIFLGCMALLFSVGLISSVVPNIPLVVALVPLLREYLATVGLITPAMADPAYTGSFPVEVLPLFYAMMYGATLGGNGTLVGASSNIVAAGIAEQYGQRISFAKFLRYGIPMAGLQLVTAALYVALRFFVFERS